MKFWQITVGEPSPFEDPRVRLLRTGILSKALKKRGHDVTWWSTTFDHFGKKFLSHQNENYEWDGGTLSLIHTQSSYSSNVSLQRIRHNQEAAKNFRQLAESRDVPDVIQCSFPTIELAEAAVQYGQKHSVPVVIDVRDLWPDVFLTAAPRFLQPLAKLALSSFYSKARFVLKNCDYITGVSQGYLDWGRKLGHRFLTDQDQVFPIGYKKSEQKNQMSSTWLRELGILPRATVVWFVGSFGRSYDLETVVKAARLLQNNGDDQFQFVISGDGDSMPKLKGLCLGLKNTLFTGWIHADRIKELQQRADIGLMAYSKGAKQGMPNKLFEYMAAGIPIISSLEGEGAQVISNYGIGVNYQPQCANSLVEQLKSLKSPESRRQIQQQCLKVFESHFSADSIYSQFSDYLERIPPRGVRDAKSH